MNGGQNRLRVWRSVIAWGWRAAPGWMAYTGTVLVANAVTTVLYPVGLALVIDSALRHQPGGVIAGVAAVAVLYTVSWALAMFAGTGGAVLSDRTTFYLTARIAEQLKADLAHIKAIDARGGWAPSARLKHGQQTFKVTGKHGFDAPVPPIPYPALQAEVDRRVLDPSAEAHTLHPAAD